MPDGWTRTTLSEACYIELGQSPPSSTYNTDGIGLPFFQGKKEFGDIYPTAVKWCSEPKKIAEVGDVLISVRAPVGSTNLNREKSCIGRGLAAIRPNDDMSNLYFLYLLRYIQQELVDQATGTTFQAISGKVLREQKIPLAPSKEQHRMVAEIEKQFTRLDQAVASLKRLQSNLARYKASVLKAACEGRLVPQDPNDEPASQLLERILAERRAQWEAQEWQNLIVKAQKKAAQAQRKKQGLPARIKDLQPGEWEAIAESEYARYLPKHDKWKEKYKEPAGVETAVLPDLPEGWVWASVNQTGSVQLGRQRTPKHHNGPHMRPYLRVANVFENRIDTSDVLKMNFSPKEFETYRLEFGDILLNEGQSLELIGRPAMYRNEVPGACFQNTLVRYKAYSGVLNRYSLVL
ncbi:MAG: hypothetical protein GY805_17705, partial [Chloroflexi bacterium]|nr:hypothetical protein [Chloroflexota bacterium]